jgi:hypothetical protein
MPAAFLALPDFLRVTGDVIGIVAIFALALLLPLFVSQNRDVRRLKAWMAADPDHPLQSMAASETLLDRAESELEALERTATPPPSGPLTPVPSPAATPVPASAPTGERPALERITQERAALAPHPRWRRFVAVATRPRVLAVVALVSVVVGVAAIVATGNLPTGNNDNTTTRPGALDPAAVKVAVLNGTSLPGLGRRVGDDVTANGFQLVTVSNSAHPFDQTVVMFTPGEQRAAQKLAHDLGVKPVQPIDATTLRDADGADVVVIAGADRAHS